MAKSKIILRKGNLVSYQTMIEEVVGGFLATQMTYEDDHNKIKEFAKKNNISTHIDKEMAYLLGDADYEIIIKKVRKRL